MFVSTGLHNSIDVYPLDADGDVRPGATIKGVATGLDDAKSIAVDSSGKIYVLNNEGGAGYTGTIEVFAPGSRGNIAPIVRIAGADTGLRSVNDIAVDSSGQIYVAIEGNGVGDASPNISPAILIYPSGSNGNVRPSETGQLPEFDETMRLCVSARVSAPDEIRSYRAWRRSKGGR